MQGKTVRLKMEKGMVNTKTLIMGTASILAVIGAYLNALGNILCFPVWLFTNMVFLINAVKERNQWMAFIFFLYFTTSALGLWGWS